MELSRRRLLQAGLLGMAGAAVGATAACGKEKKAPGGQSKNLALWYWPDGLSDKVVADVPKQFSDITFNATKIGGDFKQKLVTTITSRQFLPDITGIKGEDIAYFMTQAGQFLDLRDLGAGDLKSQYLEWKWKQGSTPDGKQIGFPIDIGPTALFYRRDVYEKAGLPTEPKDVAAAMSTWEGYFDAGVKLKQAVPKAFMVSDAAEVFGMAVGQSDKRFVDASNRFIGDQQHIRRAWDLAIKSAAKDTTGKWRVAPMPDGPANVGGSFLAITKGSGNPKKAFEIVKWLLSPENQARGYTDSTLFPSSPATYKMPALTGPDEFFGGQVTIDVFGPAAEKIPVAYESPHDSTVKAPYETELGNIESKGKNTEAAAAIPEVRAPAQRAPGRRRILSYWPQYLAISPFYVLFAAFGLFPVLFTFFLAFQRWNGLGDMQFAGLDNFRYLLTDDTFWLSLWNTLAIWVISTVPTLSLALVVAVFINSVIRGKGFYRLAFFLPNVTSVVAMAIFFGALFATNFGLVNALLHWIGAPTVAWLSNPWGMKIVIAVLTVWQWTGYNAIIYLAGLQTISSDLYDQAKVDGAGPVQTFFYITVPLLRPVILFTIVISTVGGLQTFTEPQVLVGNSGGRGQGALTMVLYFYQQAFVNNDYGYGAAIAVAVFVIVTTFTIINWRLVQRRQAD